eukprot:scaffold190339_cov40-Prasinocladus_malaysianus.AAC.1
MESLFCHEAGFGQGGLLGCVIFGAVEQGQGGAGHVELPEVQHGRVGSCRPTRESFLKGQQGYHCGVIRDRIE